MYKQPDVKECPCCGMQCQFKRYENTALEQTVWNVRPICSQAHFDSGELAHCKLIWECKTCGCSWLHGQFDKAKPA